MAERKSRFLKPASKNLVVRDPATFQPLPAGGAWKPQSAFWARRLRDRDVVEVGAREPDTKNTDSNKEG